jgi:PAS domain S-box-containing protein
MTEEMRAQEEEMRQNMEELQATQEEMQRGQAESEGAMQALNSALSVVEYDMEGKILKANRNFLEMLDYEQAEIVGEQQRLIIPKEERNTDAYRQLWRDLTSGKSVTGDFKRATKTGNIITVRVNYSPVRNRMGEWVKVIEISYAV